MSRRSVAPSVIVTGAGGVGKTTLSAALAVASARAGTRTLVLTVDPARRLADAFGVDHLGNDPVPVAGQAGLWAAMLDVTASWEAMVGRHTTSDVADRLRANPYFRAIADRFPAAQAYAAGEQMAEYLEAGAWERVIVDTPPAGGGIDFFSAPAGMRELVGGRVLRFLTGAGLPGRRALYRVTARPMLKIADAALGGPLLEEIAEFLLDLRTLYDGLSRRAEGIERYFAAARTLVVTSAQPSALREAHRFYDELPGMSVEPHAVVFNRVLPAGWSRASLDLPNDGLPARTRSSLRDNMRNWGAEARRQQDAREEFAARHATTLALVPWAPTAPTSLEELHQLVEASDGLDAAADLL